MTRIAISGAEGFLMSFVVAELLARGDEVVGVDHGERFGDLGRPHDGHPRYRRVRADARDPETLAAILADADYFIAGAALVGGVGYFHRVPYDIFAANERLTLAAIDAALAARERGRLQRLVFVSSSMVYENCRQTPFREGDQLTSPPPTTAYGFQKLAAEQALRAAHDQHGLEYAIIRPFNCVGLGEITPAEVLEARRTGAWTHPDTHVVPDLLLKALYEPGPLRLLGDGRQVRHFTHGRDLARGICLALDHPAAKNQDFNLATDEGTTVLALAQLVWQLCRPGQPFAMRVEQTYPHDVLVRVPATAKARDRLGWRAQTTLRESVTELLDWVRAVAA